MKRETARDLEELLKEFRSKAEEEDELLRHVEELSPEKFEGSLEDLIIELQEDFGKPLKRLKRGLSSNTSSDDEIAQELSQVINEFLQMVKEFVDVLDTADDHADAGDMSEGEIAEKVDEFERGELKDEISTIESQLEEVETEL